MGYRVISDVGNEDYYTISNPYADVIPSNRLKDAEFGKVGYMINSPNVTLNQKKSLPITKITFVDSVTYCAFPFDFTDLSGGALSTPDVSDLFNPKFFSEVEDDQGVIVTSDGSVWSGSYAIEENKGYKVTKDPANNDTITFYILEKLTEWGGSGQVITISQGWNLIPYSMIISRTLEDSGLGNAVSHVDRVTDGKGLESYQDPLVGGKWRGSLDKLHIGQAYWVFRELAGTTPLTLYYDDNDIAYYPSGTDIPEFINDIPRKYETDPENWLWNKEWGLGDVGVAKSSFHTTYWSRAKNWSGKYIMGDRIEYVSYDDENSKFLYKVLPPGENDWMLSFVSYDDTFYCVGAVRQNDHQFVDLLESDTEIDPSKWDPYKNDTHKALLTNPEDYTNSGKDFGKYIQAVSIAYTQGLSGTHPHFPAVYQKTFQMFYDSVLNKFYWMKEVFAGTNNLIDATSTTGEREMVHHNVHMSNQSFSSTYDTNARDIVPIKSETVNFG